MKTNLPTLTIGIPAYNEDSNIVSLLSDIQKQTVSNAYLKHIIVSSDGSTDDTVSKAMGVHDLRIVVIDNPDRQGIARGLNQIVNRATSDVLVILDGDIRITDPDFIQKLITPIVQAKADLTSSAIGELPQKTFFSKVLYVSMRLKEKLFQSFKDGKNIYTCHGLARAFSHRFYSELQFPISIGNDMYSYLACIYKEYAYAYVEEAVAWYSLPNNIEDHRKQSQRFLITEKEQEKIYDPYFIKSQTQIPLQAYISAAFQSLPIIFRYPVHVLTYCYIQLHLLKQVPTASAKQAWDIATSSKGSII